MQNMTGKTFFFFFLSLFELLSAISIYPIDIWGGLSQFLMDDSLILVSELNCYATLICFEPATLFRTNKIKICTVSYEQPCLGSFFAGADGWYWRGFMPHSRANF